MLLKSITVNGFKSFGRRTTLELDPGVTVIVGPNGSGKSNIVDAVAWATGGQSTRGLRADRSEELLFCGAAGIPPASRAEVTLVFENSSGLLPIDRPEISITRRYFRSGESDFEINRVPCRLMDITELLDAAGLRKARYALVGQGQVDQILNASQAEHRKVLEEAAGVGKHLWRRDRAIRRLESTRSDLDRVEDLIAEKRRRIRPLRRQAQVLVRYRQLIEEIRSLRLYLEGEKVREIERLLKDEVENRSWLELDRSKAAGERERGLVALAAVETAQEALRNESPSNTLRDWEMVSERMRRLSEVAALRAAAGRHRRQAELRRLALDREQTVLREVLAELDNSIERALTDEEESRAAVARLAEEERRLSVLHHVDTEAEIGALASRTATLEAASERDRREVEALDHRLGELATVTREWDAQIAGMASRLAEEKMEFDREKERLDTAKLSARENRLALQAAEFQAAEARRTLAEASGRLEAARRTLRLEDPKRGKRLKSFAGWRGWVSELLEVPSELAAAVEAGLEKWAEASAFEGPVALGNAVDRLVEGSDLEGPLLMVTAWFPDGSDSPAGAVAGAATGMTPLIDLLEGDKPSALQVRLLGDVVLVEDWKAGWELVGMHPQLRAVTRQGDLITCRGVSLGGGKRMPDLAAATAEAQKADSAVRETEEKVNRLKAEAESLQETVAVAAAVLDDRRRLLLQCEQDSERWMARRQETAGEEERLRERRRMVAEEELAREVRLQALNGKVKRLRSGLAEEIAKAKETPRQLEEVSRDRAAAEEKHRSAAVALTRLQERQRLETARHDKVLAELAKTTAIPGLSEADWSEDVAEIATTALELMADRRRVLVELDRTARQQARELAAQAAEAREAIGQADRNQRLSAAEMERVIGEIARLQTRREAIAQGLLEMGADLDLALEAPAPDAKQPEETLAALVAEMERTRPVNHYAADDLAVLEDELSDLCDQNDDIVKSARELGKVVLELEKESTDRYLVTFEKTAAAFQQTFRQVFPGGRGRLHIVDRSDPLGSGVEITARPQGKRVSRLSLLSGGERALGALAFLFALMKTRPSPFYLLDEVDATLDAVNLHRVLQLVRELRINAQILIITHQPQTAEFADVLYGVTMPPGGVTQVVSRRMDRSSSLRGYETQARSA
jgi:chromosome segregation protein